MVVVKVKLQVVDIQLLLGASLLKVRELVKIKRLTSL
jgi:hypothetical protein